MWQAQLISECPQQFHRFRVILLAVGTAKVSADHRKVNMAQLSAQVVQHRLPIHNQMIIGKEFSVVNIGEVEYIYFFAQKNICQLIDPGTQRWTIAHDGLVFYQLVQSFLINFHIG